MIPMIPDSNNSRFQIWNNWNMESLEYGIIGIIISNQNPRQPSMYVDAPDK